jgi:hypothetical protein
MENSAEAVPQDSRVSPYTAEDAEAIARARGWLAGGGEIEGATGPCREWLEKAARLLGPQSADRQAFESLLLLVFHYDAGEILARAESQAVISREGARAVLRELAALVLDSGEVNSDGYKAIIAALKERTGRRGQELFHPVRLALAGRAGEGEYDRVILLLDAAAGVPWAVPVKGCRQRILEFCGALD